MASSTTPIPLMRAESMASGVCTSGSTALPRDAMRLGFGGGAMTSTGSEDGQGGRMSAPPSQSYLSRLSPLPLPFLCLKRLLEVLFHLSEVPPQFVWVDKGIGSSLF